MALDPSKHIIPGHRSAYDASVYHDRDTRLVGYGAPPSDPAYQRDNPGGGRLEMSLEMVKVEDVPATYRPEESRWRRDPAGSPPFDLPTP